MPVSASIIIPTYNRPQWLRTSVASACTQTDGNVEVIIVDDGSDNRDAEQYAATLPNIRYIYQSNQGLGAARNTGLAAATGEWIQFLDDDDWLSPDAIQKKLALLQREQSIGAVYSDLILTNENGQSIRNYYSRFTRPLPEGDLYPLLLEQNFIPVHALLWRKSILQKIGGFPSRSGFEDWEMLIRAAEISQFRFIDEAFGFYRLHHANMHKKFNFMYAGRLAFQSTIVNSNRFQSLPSGSQIHFLSKFAFQQIAYGEPQNAQFFLKQAALIDSSARLPRLLSSSLRYAEKPSRWIFKLIIKARSTYLSNLNRTI